MSRSIFMRYTFRLCSVASMHHSIAHFITGAQRPTSGYHGALPRRHPQPDEKRELRTRLARSLAR
eukprot:4967216-Pleurochrysis_carterae.AAC.2